MTIVIPPVVLMFAVAGVWVFVGSAVIAVVTIAVWLIYHLARMARGDYEPEPEGEPD